MACRLDCTSSVRGTATHECFAHHARSNRCSRSGFPASVSDSTRKRIGRVCRPGSFVILSEQVNHVRHVGGTPHRHRYPPGVGKYMMRFRPAARYEFVANGPRKRQIRDRSVQMTKLASSDPELDPAESV